MAPPKKGFWASVFGALLGGGDKVAPPVRRPLTFDPVAAKAAAAARALPPDKRVRFVRDYCRTAPSQTADYWTDHRAGAARHNLFVDVLALEHGYTWGESVAEGVGGAVPDGVR